jgi:hypothetical protein
MAARREAGQQAQRKEAIKMSRTIKTLGMAVLAVLAIGAIAASAAQAGAFTAAGYPATITGSAVGSHELGTELGVLKCGPTFHGELAAASAELTLTPNYGTSCSIGGKEVHVNNNGCDYLLHAAATVEADVVSGSMDVKCPAGNKMDFEITSMPTCHLTVPAQAGLGTLTYTNRTAAKDVDLDFKIEGLFYELDFGCAVVGGFANGTYKGTSTLKADHEGAATSFGVD